MRPSDETVASILNENGYKLTRQRLAVLDVIVNSQEHLTPAAVYERVIRTHPRIGLVTVYRTLEMLSELGLICRVHRGGKSRSYTLAPFGHHHHLVCTQCGVVVDFTDCGLMQLEEKLAHDTGFDIEGHLLQFVGTCERCRRQA